MTENIRPFFANALILFPLAAGVSFANENVQTNVPLISVTAPAQTAGNAKVFETLRTAPGVAINSAGGSQNDITIRGSAFSAAGLSIGGIPLRTPLTEHHHAEFPLPPAMMSRPKVLTGISNQGGHLTGTVNFNLLPVTGKRQIEAGFGSDHRDWQNLLLQHMLTEEFGIGFFAGRESAAGVDYSDNDYDRETIGGHTQFRNDDTQVDLVVTHQEKEFGARGYYGVNDAIAALEKIKETLVFLSAVKGDLKNDYLRGGLLWREFNNDYRLETGYRNQHRIRTGVAFFDGRTLEVNGWALGWRADVEEERIASTGVGGGGLGHHHRTRGGVSLLPQWSGDRLKIVAGMRGEFFTGESPEYLPQTEISYHLSDSLTAFASYNETVRLPSFIELNYQNAFTTGNAALKPQTEQQTEAGLRGIPSEFMDWKTSVFHRRSSHTIDWMRTAPGGAWNATDLGRLNTYGVDAQLNWYPAQNFEAQLAYTWVYKDKDAGDFNGYASRYALDYPEHLLQASLTWKPIDAVEIGALQTVRKQTENRVRRGSDFGFDSSLVARYTPPKYNFATLSLIFNNIWDDDFEYFPGQRRASRYVGASLTLNF